jgi:predicted enzyme related to lactoylglutathione lyase
MHKSKLAGFIIDCETDDLPAAAAFWSAALGMRTETLGSGEETYVGLEGGTHGLHVEVQRVAHPSRVHLDIAADDIDKEVTRLELLGARRIERVKSWCVMEAPTGQRFCVVEAEGDDFDDVANIWA